MGTPPSPMPPGSRIIITIGEVRGKRKILRRLAVRVAEYRKEPNVDSEHKREDDGKNKLLCVRFIVYRRSYSSINGAVYKVSQDKIYHEKARSIAHGIYKFMGI